MREEHTQLSAPHPLTSQRAIPGHFKKSLEWPYQKSKPVLGACDELFIEPPRIALATCWGRHSRAGIRPRPRRTPSGPSPGTRLNSFPGTFVTRPESLLRPREGALGGGPVCRQVQASSRPAPGAGRPWRAGAPVRPWR